MSAESENNKLSVDEYVKNLITKSVDEQYKNDDINDVTNLIMKKVEETYVHISRIVIMAYMTKGEKEGEVFVRPHVGRFSRPTILEAFGGLQVDVPNLVNFMDMEVKKKQDSGIIVPGDNGQGKSRI